MTAASIIDTILVKREGLELTDEQIRVFVQGYARGQVPHEQASALLMAIVFQGLGPRELATWTEQMIASGVRLDLSRVARPTVDKHSTGGVGDKISLVLAPLVAACGAAVPQLSGRGLAHTGGTLDKLESIPGFRTDLSGKEFIDQLTSVGAVIAAAGHDLAPADKRLYALRDVTGTVESIPLIASSIMSKKIAEGTESLVLDVKVGKGAFMRDVDAARSLARTMVQLGDDHDVRTVALLTGMDAPTGRAAGNAIEVAEAVETLAGGGPDDVRAVTLALAEQMLELAGIDADPAAALADGSAMDAWRALVTAQGGDPDAELPAAKITEVVTAQRDGVIASIDALEVGVAAWRLGAGRQRQGEAVSPGAGVLLHVGERDRVAAGAPLAELYSDEEDRIAVSRDAVTESIVIADTAPDPPPLIIDTIAC